jgi:hypothetical protein
LYTLQPYIHEHWLDHLLAFAAEVTQARDRQLEACLEIFLFVYSHQYARYLDPANRVQPDTLAARNSEPRLRYLEHYGHHYRYLCVYVNYRHAKQVHFEMPADHSKPFLDRHHQMANICSLVEPLDPTPLSVVQLEYAKQVEFLLSADAVPGLTPEELTMFKSTNRPYAFVCRFPGCPGMLAGFSTHDLRTQHEMTHKPALFCTHSGCKYSLPFASRQNLGKHIRDYHSSVPRNIPTSIRHRQAMHLRNRGNRSRTTKTPRSPDVLHPKNDRRRRLSLHGTVHDPPLPSPPRIPDVLHSEEEWTGHLSPHGGNAYDPTWQYIQRDADAVLSKNDRRRRLSLHGTVHDPPLPDFPSEFIPEPPTRQFRMTSDRPSPIDSWHKDEVHQSDEPMTANSNLRTMLLNAEPTTELMETVATDDLEELFNMGDYERPEQSGFDDKFFNFE